MIFKIELKIKRNTDIFPQFHRLLSYAILKLLCNPGQKGPCWKHAFCILKHVFNLKTQKIFRPCWNSCDVPLCDCFIKFFYRNDRIKIKTDIISEGIKLLWSYICSLVEIRMLLKMFVGNSCMKYMLWKFFEFNLPVNFLNFLSNWVNLLDISSGCEKLRAFERYSSFETSLLCLGDQQFNFNDHAENFCFTFPLQIWHKMKHKGNFKQWFNVFLAISEAWQGYELKAWVVLNHHPQLRPKKFIRTRDIPNFPTQGWVATTFYTINWNRTSCTLFQGIACAPGASLCMCLNNICTPKSACDMWLNEAIKSSIYNHYCLM